MEKVLDQWHSWTQDNTRVDFTPLDPNDQQFWCEGDSRVMVRDGSEYTTIVTYHHRHLKNKITVHLKAIQENPSQP